MNSVNHLPALRIEVMRNQLKVWLRAEVSSDVFGLVCLLCSVLPSLVKKKESQSNGINLGYKKQMVEISLHLVISLYYSIHSTGEKTDS